MSLILTATGFGYSSSALTTGEPSVDVVGTRSRRLGTRSAKGRGPAPNGVRPAILPDGPPWTHIGEVPTSSCPEPTGLVGNLHTRDRVLECMTALRMGASR